VIKLHLRVELTRRLEIKHIKKNAKTTTVSANAVNAAYNKNDAFAAAQTIVNTNATSEGKYRYAANNGTSAFASSHGSQL